MFFQTAANLNDNEKARLELIAHRFQGHVDGRFLTLPVRSISELSVACATPPSAENLIGFVGEHLGVCFDGMKIRKDLKVLNETGGGG